MSDFTPVATLWLAKVGGALAGSAISLAYLLPRNRREAAVRFLASLSSGLVFGGTAGVVAVDRLGIAGMLGQTETVMMGSALASLTIWWALGFGIRLAERLFPPHMPSRKTEKDDHNG